MIPNELSLTTSHARSNLKFALLWMPRRRRADALLFYRFCRTIDDIADDAGRSADEKHDLLSSWIEATKTSLPADLEPLVERHNIDRNHLTEIIKGCASDICRQPFSTYLELEAYCWRVACAVGLVSIRIFGCVDPLSEQYAIHLGHALQLTNILRDVGDDARQGRVYLPLEDLDRHGVDIQHVLERRPSRDMTKVLSTLAARARCRFASAKVPPSDFQALLPARIMQAFYEKTLNRIEVAGFPIFHQRIRLGKLEKLTCAVSASLQRQYH